MDNLDRIVKKIIFEKSNIILGVKDQDEIIDSFLDSSSKSGFLFEAITIDAKDIIKSLENFQSSLNHIYDTEKLFKMNLPALKRFRELIENERFTFFKNIYEEYIAILIFFRIGDSEFTDLPLVTKKLLIEEGDYIKLATNDPILLSNVFYKYRRKNDITKIVFLKNAQFVVDYNMHEAIESFIFLESADFKFNYITESEEFFSRDNVIFNDNVNLVNNEAKKNTK